MLAVSHFGSLITTFPLEGERTRSLGPSPPKGENFMSNAPPYQNPIEDLGRTAARFSKQLLVKHARIPGVRILVRHDRCNGCGSCVRKGFCRVGAISVVDRKAKVDEKTCRGCTRVTHLCPKDALAMEIRPPAPVRLALKRLDQGLTGVLGDRR